MLDFFTIFSKGGIVLWCFQGAGVTESFTGPVNALIRSVILQVGNTDRSKARGGRLYLILGMAELANATANRKQRVVCCVTLVY